MTEELERDAVPVDAAASATAAATVPKDDRTAALDKIVVAIHGVSSQRRGETIRHVTSQFGRLVEPPLATMPLGFFHIDKLNEVKGSRLEDVPPGDPLERNAGRTETPALRRRRAARTPAGAREAHSSSFTLCCATSSCCTPGGTAS